MGKFAYNSISSTSYKIILIEGFPKMSRTCPNFPKGFYFDFFEISMSKIIQNFINSCIMKRHECTRPH